MSEELSIRPVSWLPIHLFLACIVATCLTGALLTDVAYWRTAVMMWSNFSAWLISAGAILAWLFAILGLIELVLRPSVRSQPWMPHYGAANIAVILLATFNMLVHSRDAWTSVVPTGLILSVLTVLALLVTAWFGIRLAYPSRPGVLYP